MSSKKCRMDQEDVEVKAKRKKSKHSLETIQEEHVKNKRKSKKDKKSKQREETEVDKQISVGNKTEDGETDEYASDRPVQVSVVTNKKDSIVGTSNDKDDTINWPEHDLSELFKRIEVCLPEKDTLSYSTRAEKLCWDNIAFKSYTGEECKRTWMLVQKRVRRFRILSEVLSDAREWISKPWTNFYKGAKAKRHPEMPRRPLSTYMLFYLKKKDKIIARNSGISVTELSKKIAEMYKQLSPEKREKYHRLALMKKKEYEEKLDEFYRTHPDVQRNSEKSNQQKVVEPVPKKPLTPFGIYYREQQKTMETDVHDIHTFKEKCKEEWKNMPEEKKVVWIDWALDEEMKYKDEIKTYASKNPNFVQTTTTKPILTKEEKLIKERIAGKPIKPPNSAYSLFSKLLLQSQDIKSVQAKDRMNYIAHRWKMCTEEEKKQYKERANHLMEQYKLNFASYLESLPEDKRVEELQNNVPKRKTKSVIPTTTTTATNNTSEETEMKKKAKKIKVADSEKLSSLLKKEPKQPPKSSYELFCTLYTGNKNPKRAWKALSADERKKLHNKVTKLRKAYMMEFEKFLKGLNKEQLTAFKNARQNAKKANSGADEADDFDNSTDSSLSSSSSSSS